MSDAETSNSVEEAMGEADRSVGSVRFNMDGEDIASSRLKDSSEDVGGRWGADIARSSNS